jgi:hypothetical protein
MPIMELWFDNHGYLIQYQDLHDCQMDYLERLFETVTETILVRITYCTLQIIGKMQNRRFL